MADFLELYDQFLALIEDENDRAEVSGYLSAMSKSDASAPEYEDAQRSLVRVLKSRAPHALPVGWRDFPELEHGILPSDRAAELDAQIRSDWKEVMEEVGVFFFGSTPTWDDIDSYSEHDLIEKHYGVKGWWRKPGPDERGVKPPHASHQESHGNAVGVRHMIVRILAAPRFRNKVEELARHLGLPENTPYRDMFTPARLKDEGYRSKVEDLFRSTFQGALDEAVQGTGSAGENFKLSAGSGRGRRADEHQDPTVAHPAVMRNEVERLLQIAEDGGPADSSVRELTTARNRMLRMTKAATLRRLADQHERAMRAAKGKLTRLHNQGASEEEISKAVEEVHASTTRYLKFHAVLEGVLENNEALRNNLGASPKDVEFLKRHLNNATAWNSLSRARLFAAQHQHLSYEAAPHPRRRGPDQGESDKSYFVVPNDELDKIFNDLRNHKVPQVQEWSPAGREQRDESQPFRRGMTAAERSASNAAQRESSAAARQSAREARAAQQAASDQSSGKLSGKGLQDVVTPILMRDHKWASPDAEAKFYQRHKDALSAITSDMGTQEINDIVDKLIDIETGGKRNGGAKGIRRSRRLLVPTEAAQAREANLRAGNRNATVKPKNETPEEKQHRLEQARRAAEGLFGGGGASPQDLAAEDAQIERMMAEEAAQSAKPSTPKPEAPKPKSTAGSDRAASSEQRSPAPESNASGGDGEISDFVSSMFPKMPGPAQNNPFKGTPDLLNYWREALSNQVSGDESKTSKLKSDMSKLQDGLRAVSQDENLSASEKATKVFDLLSAFSSNPDYAKVTGNYVTNLKPKLDRYFKNLSDNAKRGEKKARLPLPGARLEPSQSDMGDGTLPDKTVSGSQPLLVPRKKENPRRLPPFIQQ